MLTIVSGGQTGVDRAALDVAIELGIDYRGWCPRGGSRRGLPDPPGVLALYPDLRETPDADPRQRTEWNVRDSDKLLVLVDRAGLRLSKELGSRFAVPRRSASLMSSSVSTTMDARARAAAFLGEGQGPLALNIAGPRESEAPGIYAKARAFLARALGE